MSEIKPTPTTRAVIDVGRHCNIQCRFCYHSHLGDLSKQNYKPMEQLISEGEEAVKRGNTYLDVTGGEPTAHPHMANIIKYFKDRGIRMCIISNGIVNQEKLLRILASEPDDFLMSLHGTDKTHNFLTCNEQGMKILDRTLHILHDSFIKFRFNFVINRYNQSEIMDCARYMALFKPRIVNFINMNLHHGWKFDEKAKEVISNLREAEPVLNSAIKLLEDSGVGVNVRYYPMCRISEDYRRCIANDRHVVFDPYEWDYNILPKKYEPYNTWGLNETKNVEEKGEPCCRCDLQWICGGINKYFHRMSNMIYPEVCTPIKVENLSDKNDFYYYRKNNVLTLQSRN